MGGSNTIAPSRSLRQVRTPATTNPLDAILYGACCNLLIEEVARAAQDDITREAARAGLFTRMRFSPGNGDLPLTIQPQPIKAIAVKYGCCVIGLRLTEKTFRLTAQERFRTVLQRAIGKRTRPDNALPLSGLFFTVGAPAPKGLRWKQAIPKRLSSMPSRFTQAYPCYPNRQPAATKQTLKQRLSYCDVVSLQARCIRYTSYVHTLKGAPSMNMPHCSAQKRCGACQLLSLPYEKQLERKQNEMIELFEPFAGEGTVFNPIAGMDEPYYYRNKVTSPYVPGRKNKGGKKPRGKKGNAGAKSAPQHEILCGMYAAGTHRVINTDSCLLENKDAKQAVLAIRSLMQRYHMEPYNEDTNTGFIRHAVIRVGHTTGELLVTVVTNGKEFPASRNFCRELKKRCPAITTVVQNVNTRQTNVILGDEGEKTLYGPGFIIDELCGLTFRISSHSFYQVNATQTEVLYRKAIEMAHFTGTETAMDAYCGTGTIGLVAAKGLPGAETAHAARVIGVDNVASAIKDARENARHNGIENADFTAEDAGHFMDKLAREGESLDVLLMDPPRAGSNEQFLRSACSLTPKRIVYISCNPNTQARDVEYLVKNGYQLTEVQPVDMFPHTNHAENICALELQ